jgi:hypothetical protein
VDGALRGLEAFEQALGPGEPTAEEDDPVTLELLSEGEQLCQYLLHQFEIVRCFSRGLHGPPGVG